MSYMAPALQAGGHWFESSSPHRSYRRFEKTKVTEKDTVQSELYPIFLGPPTFRPPRDNKNSDFD